MMENHHLETSDSCDRPSKRSKFSDAGNDTGSDTGSGTGTDSTNSSSAVDKLSLSLAETLGFGNAVEHEGQQDDAERGDADDDDTGDSLLELVLSHLCSWADLVSTRRVCRPFLRCSDKIAAARVPVLIGPHMRPMIGQTMLGLLRGAEEADEITLRKLREWDAETGRARGFDVGLPTAKPKDGRWHVIATVPAAGSVPDARIPFRIKFGSVVMTLEGDAIVRRRPPEIMAPMGFFHINAYKHSGRLLGGRINDLHYDHGLNDILVRVEHSLAYPDLTYGLNSDAVTLIRADQASGTTGTYNEYATMFVRCFELYGLGEPLPDLLERVNEALVLKLCELDLIRRRELQAAQDEESDT